MNQESWNELLSKKGPAGEEAPPGSKRISSPSTYFYKKVFPMLWFGMIAVITTGVIQATFNSMFVGRFNGQNNPPATSSPASSSKKNGPSPIIVIFPMMVMAGGGYMMMRHFLWDLVDEVIDTGDAFIVRKGTLEERIPISNVINVSSQTFSNPPRITLTLKQPGVFGKEFSFMTQHQRAIFPFKRNPFVDELIERVDAARRSLPPGAN